MMGTPAIEITEEPILISPTCAAANDGKVIVKLNGGVGEFQVLGYPSVWDGETLTVSRLSVGEFSLLIRDEKDCNVSFGGGMTGPEPLQVSFISKSPSCPGYTDGEVTAEVTGGREPYIYQWEDGSTDPFLSGFGTGTYEVSITDANGCILTTTSEIQQAVSQIRMPTGFNPQDGPYLPIFICEVTYKRMIWNRWGQLVYAGSEGWDGRISGVESLLGGYSFLLQFSYLQNDLIQTGELRGSFVLIQ